MKLFVLLLGAITLVAQTESPKTALGRIIGEVTVKDDSGTQLTVKSDAGASYTVSLNEKTLFLRVPPGEKDLKKASKIAAADVKVGDRVMARGAVSEELKSFPAVAVIVMTKEDLAQKQQREQGEWQTRGASGVVKSVTPDLVISTRAREGVTALITVVPGPNVKVRRYAPDSVLFSDAKPVAISEIRPGDQARVLGQKNADGTRIEAEEMIFGTFRNIAGTVISIDAGKNEIQLKDLDTKKPVTIKLNAASQLHKLPPMAAMMLARRLNPSFQGSAGAAGGPSGPGGTAGGTAAFRPGAAPQGSEGSPQGAARRSGAEGGPAGPGVPGGPGAAGAGDRPRMGGGGGGNFEQMMEHLPAFTLAELTPGEPLIISTTAPAGANAASAISVLSGVEPILRAAPAGSGVNLGGWSLEMNMPAQ